ncbi:permease-like cell division protein FtsX [Candidatus Venteria ishoeyi]|uniref:Cell division protein FtsX n=1 Tax=Candidatus Venteria ishoeyi TaxID=1899563 RepID=A0A1H6FEH3_9GAMM|nr:permease-like cell division protein FtsX [Candidatus Venteria ishoeyi]SEH08462.1 Cell division protein FtsX [Candidatus Venteria ishoeyi]
MDAPIRRKKNTRRPARKSAPTPGRRKTPGIFRSRLRPLDAWLLHHLHVLVFSLGQLSRTPFPTLMTAAVIGIALALPSGLYLLLDNARQLSQSWDDTVRISVFLNIDVSDVQAQQLATKLQQRSEIQQVQVISRAKALAEYQQLSGFSEALETLDGNPLPAVLVVQPQLNPELGASQNSQVLLALLQALPEVDIAQFDMRWLKRLLAIMEIIHRSVLVLAALLGLAVLLITGNTIRLSIQNRRQEIEINKLFGATDAFIRRPFLYAGLWYGLFGAVIAWSLVQLAFALLQNPVQKLSVLYQSHYQLSVFSYQDVFLLLATGVVLGLAGAWLAVSRHLQEIQPR